MCSNLHPDNAIQCRLDGPHPKHVIGFGKSMLTWPNEDFRPVNRRVSRGQMVDWAKRIKEAQP